MSRRLVLLLAAGAGLIVATLSAASVQDSIALLPSSNSLGSNVAVFGINPLNSLGSFSAGDSTYLMLPKPDGSKYYLVAKTGNGSVTTVDSNFSNPKSIASFQTSSPCVGASAPPPTCTGAAMTPDGSKFLVAANTIHIFETTKDQELVPGGINTGVAIFDVAVSLDGAKAYTLGLSSTGGSQVNVIDLTTNTKAPPSYGVLGTATAITVGYNGRVYVSTQNQIIELDPTTLQPTAGGIIGVNAKPGKLVFTPDGKYALTVNLTPITGYSLILIDLATHSAFPEAANLNVVLDTLLVANSTTLFAYSSQTEQLYQVGIGTGGAVAIGGANVGGAPTTFVNGVAISDEQPFLGNTTAHYLFILANNILYRVDLTVGQLTAQTTISNQQYGALNYVPLPSTSAPVVLLPYGDKQTVAPSKSSLPLVVRALDTNGRPVSGATITFAASVNTASVSPASVTTGANGFAETIFTAPPTNGTVSVTYTTGNLKLQAFTITVGSGSTPSSGNLTIVAGQGQVLASNTNTGIAGFGSLLTVQLNDLNGKPVSGAPIVFTITSGAGSLFGGTKTATGVTITTNAQGQAGASFLTSVVPPGLGSTQTSITAKGSGTNTVTFFESTYPNNPALTPQPQFLSPQAGQVLTGQAGTIIKGAFSAVIVDATGFPLPNVSVRACQPQPPPGPGLPGTCTVPPANSAVPFGACADPTGQGVVSDAHGRLNCDLQLNGVVGTGHIGFEVGYHFDTPVSYTLKITAGLPGVINLVQGNNQTGKPGQQLPQALVVQVQDSFGNVLPFTPVTWTVQTSGAPATLQQTSSATDGNGNASTLVTLGNTAGTAIVQITAGDVSASFSLTVSNPAAGIQAVSGNNQSVIVSNPFPSPLLIKVVDGQGNGVSGAPVTFTLTSGSATIGTPSTTTDTNGQASTQVTAGSSPGNIVITATAGAFSVTFNLSSHLAGPQNIVFVNGASFILQHGCVAPGCVAPGEVVTVQGSGFATGIQGVLSGLSILGPLPTTLGGVSITFNGVAAPIFYVANVNGVESMTIQVPFETQLGSASVVLNGAGGGSVNLVVQVQLYAPGVFTSTYGNQVVAVAVRPDGSYVSPNNPAHLGEVIVVFVTGLGQVSPAANTNQQGSGQAVTATVVTGINNSGVGHTKLEYAPGLVGVYLVGIQIPTNTKTGPKQPIGLILSDQAGNFYYSQATYIPIAP